MLTAPWAVAPHRLVKRAPRAEGPRRFRRLRHQSHVVRRCFARTGDGTNRSV